LTATLLADKIPRPFEHPHGQGMKLRQRQEKSKFPATEPGLDDNVI